MCSPAKSFAIVCALLFLSCTAGVSTVPLSFVSLTESGQVSAGGGGGSGGGSGSSGGSGGGTSQGGSTNPTILIPPNFSTIQSAMLAANNIGLVVGQAFNGVTFPPCTKGDGSALDFAVTYSLSGLPSWLAFNAATRQVTLSGTTTVPQGAATSLEVTYTCTSVDDATLSAFRTFIINDADLDGMLDTSEFRFGAVPLIGVGGALQLTTNDSALFRSIATGVTRVTSGLAVNNSADATQDPDNDGVTTRAEIAAGTNPFVKASQGTLTRGSTDFSTTNFGNFVTAADFNGDGFLDLAAPNSSSQFDCVSIRLGTGSAFGDQSLLCFNGVLQGVVAADFDRDGDTDIAVADLWNFRVSVALNNGNGTFGAEVEYTVGDEPYGMIAGDFNGDGFMDLATANVATNNPNDDGSVSVLINNGNGTFANERRLTAGRDPVGITAADFNGDGKLDLAVANSFATSNTQDVSILLGNGDGTFQTASHIDVDIVGANMLRTGDFDNDGDYDLAGTSFGNKLFVLLNNGNGSFASPTTYAAGGDGQELAIFDIDGDGDLDLIAADSTDDTISIFKGNGNGTFQERTTVATGDNPGGLAPGDFDNDGDIDLAVFNANDTDISIFTNQ